MNGRIKERDFLQKVLKALHAGEQSIDASTRSRLSRIRHEALNRKKRKGGAWLPKWFGLPAAGVAVAVGVIILFHGTMREPCGPPEMEQAIVDVEILTADESFEFFENLEFYVWLSGQNEIAG